MIEKCYHFYAEARSLLDGKMITDCEGSFSSAESCYHQDFMENVRSSIKNQLVEAGFSPMCKVIVKSLTRID